MSSSSYTPQHIVRFNGRMFTYFPKTGTVYISTKSGALRKCSATDKDGYHIVKMDGYRYSLARIACIARESHLDYYDRSWSAVRRNYDRSDMTGKNLIAVSGTIKNMHSRKRKGAYSSDFKGVYIKRGKAYATCNGETLGSFKSQYSAAAVYNYRAKQIAGNLANINLV